MGTPTGQVAEDCQDAKTSGETHPSLLPNATLLFSFMSATLLSSLLSETHPLSLMSETRRILTLILRALAETESTTPVVPSQPPVPEKPGMRGAIEERYADFLASCAYTLASLYCDLPAQTLHVGSCHTCIAVPYVCNPVSTGCAGQIQQFIQ